MKKLCALLAATATLCAFSAEPAQAASQRPIRLKMQTQFMDRHPIVQKVWKPWIEEIKKRTDGRVIITFYNPNTICPDGELLDAVLKGQVDIGDHQTTRNPGRMPMNAVMAKLMPGSSVKATTRAYWELYQTTPGIQDEFKGMKVLGLHIASPVEIHTKTKRVETLADIKGLRLVGPGKDSMLIGKGLGADPISQPGSEMYMALSRNMAEGAIYPIPVFRSFKLNEATRYTTLINSVSGSQWMAMNQTTWDKLPPKVQKVFEETTGEVMSMAMADAIMEGTAKDMEAMKKEGHEFIIMSEEERAKCFEQLMPVLKAGWREELGSQPKVADPDALYRKAQALVNKYSDMERAQAGK